MSIMSMAILAMLTFVSCSKDDDDTANDVDKNIIGDWGINKVSDTDLFLERISLKSNGSFTITDYEATGTNLDSGGSISHMEKAEYSGTYTATNGQLKLSANGQSISYSYSVSGSILTLIGSDGSITYDKIDSNIKAIFDSAEQWYQQHK